MQKEDLVKDLIKSRGFSIKSFAKYIGLPYTTLLGMLKNGLGGAAVDSVIKICVGLGIQVEDLILAESGANNQTDEVETSLVLTELCEIIKSLTAQQQLYLLDTAKALKARFGDDK